MHPAGSDANSNGKPVLLTLYLAESGEPIGWAAESPARVETYFIGP